MNFKESNSSTMFVKTNSRSPAAASPEESMSSAELMFLGMISTSLNKMLVLLLKGSRMCQPKI